MGHTYAYNSIILGVLVGPLVSMSTGSNALGIIAFFAVSIIGFVAIRFIEDSISSGIDKAVDKAAEVYKKHKGTEDGPQIRSLNQKITQDANTGTTQFPSKGTASVNTTQFPSREGLSAEETRESIQDKTDVNGMNESNHQDDSAEIKETEALQEAMFCPNCGAKLLSNARFCSSCGELVD